MSISRFRLDEQINANKLFLVGDFSALRQPFLDPVGCEILRGRSRPWHGMLLLMDVEIWQTKPTWDGPKNLVK